MEYPLISIITATYQAQHLIEATIRSVSEQSFPHIQHVLVDARSTDNTVAIAKAYIRPNSIIICEKDKGLYDAMNKGLRHAQGEYVLFLNAGDILHDHSILEKMVASMPHADCYYGDTAIIDEQGKFVAMRRHTPPDHLNWRSFDMGMCVSHQSILMRRKLAVQFDLNYRISADIDWCIRSLKNAQLVQRCPIVVSDFMIGGVSTNQRWKGLTERWKIMVKHYGLVHTLWSHFKIACRFIGQRATRRNMD
jgi:glycosyltransferase involved in cell wall biosynthesis